MLEVVPPNLTITNPSALALSCTHELDSNPWSCLLDLCGRSCCMKRSCCIKGAQSIQETTAIVPHVAPTSCWSGCCVNPTSRACWRGYLDKALMHISPEAAKGFKIFSQTTGSDRDEDVALIVFGHLRDSCVIAPLSHCWGRCSCWMIAAAISSLRLAIWSLSPRLDMITLAIVL